MNVEYREAVQEARRLVKRSEEDQWRLAQLTWEQVEAGVSRRQWATDTGMAPSHAQVLYRVWAEHAADRARPPFADTYSRFMHPAYNESESPEAGRARSAVRNMPVEQKAEVARELLAEPKVADSVMRDPHTRRQITDSRERIVEEIEEAARDRQETSPAQRDLARVGLHTEIANDLSNARYRVAEATRKLQDFGDRPVDISDAAQRVRDILDWFDVVWRGGTVDDAALERLLGGEQ